MDPLFNFIRPIGPSKKFSVLSAMFSRSHDLRVACHKVSLFLHRKADTEAISIMENFEKPTIYVWEVYE